ncbi:MAG: hypothetical protein ACI8QF_003596 [Limisphaerales bacterium]|jgi:hypothetical protein
MFTIQIFMLGWVSLFLYLAFLLPFTPSASRHPGLPIGAQAT